MRFANPINRLRQLTTRKKQGLALLGWTIAFSILAYFRQDKLAFIVAIAASWHMQTFRDRCAKEVQ